MSFTPEHALLLDAIAPLDQPRVDPAGWEGRRWGEVLSCADWHRLSPVLFSHLESHRGVPGAVRSALERAYLANAARSLFIAEKLRQVVGVLGEAGVPPMLLKGAALVETVYPDRAHREMLDLDILVPSEQLAAASRALVEQGYTPETEASPDDGSLRLATKHHHDAALIDGQQLVAVELHRHIAIADEGGGFVMDGFWKRSRRGLSGDHLLPSPEDLLLHVCLHFTRNRLGGSYRRRHTGGALGQVCDIARLVEHEPIDWARLAASAREYRVGARVFLALFAARELGVSIDEQTLRPLAPPGFDRRVGRDLVELRVMRAGNHLPVRTLKWMFAPSREVLSRGWNADSTATLSLARAYVRRARANVPRARSSLRRPWSYVQDQRLNSRIRALEEKV